MRKSERMAHEDFIPGRDTRDLPVHDDERTAALDPRCVIGLFAEMFQFRSMIQGRQLEVPDLRSLFDVHLLQLDDRPQKSQPGSLPDLVSHPIGSTLLHQTSSARFCNFSISCERKEGPISKWVKSDKHSFLFYIV
jgi:hypothetical protein